MTDQKQTVVIPSKPKAPEGFWSLPGGIKGSPEGVGKAIDTMADVPQSEKDYIKAKVASSIAETGNNFVVVRANAVRRDDDFGRHDIIGFEIQTTKVNS